MQLISACKFYRAAAMHFVVVISVASLILLLIDRAKAAAIIIVAIGASNTSGWGVGLQHAFPTIIEATLRARGYDVQVINAGIPLHTTAAILARLNTTVPNGTRLVIIDQTTADPIYGVSQAQSKANFRAMVGSLRSRNIKSVLADLRPIYSRGFVQPDRIHLSARGHYAAAAMLLPQIIAAINK